MTVMRKPCARCMARALAVAIVVIAAAPVIAQESIAPLTAATADCVVKLYGPKVGREHGYGSGVLVSADGRILTTLSLLVNLRGVKVVLADGRHFEAELERADEARQLALLKIDARNLPHLSPQSSADLQQGDTVIALGNWFKIADGREPVSVCKGILGLRTTIDAMRLAQESDIVGEVLVLDALTANPGAAGGPLLDARGRFVGLVGKIIESATTNTRINYAIPGESAVAFLGGEIAAASAAAPPPAKAPTGKPFVGIRLSKLGYRQVAAYVERVSRNSPADKAGIRPDDLILAVGGQRVRDVSSYEEIVAKLMPGQSVPFTVKRGPEVLTLTLQVEAMK